MFSAYVDVLEILYVFYKVLTSAFKPGCVTLWTRSNQSSYECVFNRTVTEEMDTDCVYASVGMYPLRSINDRLLKIIDACYSNNGIIEEKSAVYSPYSSKSEELCSSNSPVSKSLCVSKTRTVSSCILMSLFC